MTQPTLPGIPGRPLVRVVNVRGMPPDDPGVVYVGRRCAGWPAHPLANPFKLTVDTPEARAECLIRYRAWLLDLPDLAGRLEQLWWETERGRKPLACWCAPKLCHAGVLAELLAAGETIR